MDSFDFAPLKLRFEPPAPDLAVDELLVAMAEREVAHGISLEQTSPACMRARLECLVAQRTALVRKLRAMQARQDLLLGLAREGALAARSAELSLQLQPLEAGGLREAGNEDKA